MKTISYKMGGSVKDVDVEKRIVTGYYTSTGTLDSDEEIFNSGAFKKTIEENGPNGKNRIWHLWMHNMYHPINKPHVLEEHPQGVYFETKMINTPASILALELYQQGALTEHSVMFRVIKSMMDNETKIRTLLEVKMYEGSSVLWGANENTPFTGFKSENHLSTLEKMLRNGQFKNDDVYELILIEIEKIKSTIALEAGMHHFEPQKQVGILTSIINKI